jgi:DNA-binding response OmpR family regulator
MVSCSAESGTRYHLVSQPIMTRILIIEDEPDMVLGLQDNLELEGYEVIVARDGAEGLHAARQTQPDLILLDVMLPKKSGLEVCRELRVQGFAQPILMLTARGQELDKVAGLELGADDYITKPFGLSELLARVRAHLRRAARQTSESAKELAKELESYAFGSITLDFKKYQATKNHQALELSPREFELLKYFIHHRGEAVTRDQLLDGVWGYTTNVFTRTVDNHIAKLRHKIEDDPEHPQYLMTVHRVGYRFLG